MVRIVVADDHALVRDTLRRVIEREPDLQVIGEAAAIASTIDQVRTLRPDLLLLDLTMPGGGGIAALGEIRAASQTTRILVLTMHDDPAYLRAALTMGASGFLCKEAAGRELATAARAILQGRTYVDPVMAGAALAEIWRPAGVAAQVEGAGSGVRASAWSELLAAALSHDIVNFVMGTSADPDAAGPDPLSGHLRRLQNLGLRLRTLASAGRGGAEARLDQTCQDALLETTRLPTQSAAVEPIGPELRVAAPAAAVRTALVSLLDHVFAACPDVATVHVSARRSGGQVEVAIAAPQAWTVAAGDDQPLDVLLAAARCDLRGDSSLVIAGAIADALGGAIRMTSGAAQGLRLTLHLKAAV